MQEFPEIVHHFSSSTAVFAVLLQIASFSAFALWMMWWYRKAMAQMEARLRTNQATPNIGEAWLRDKLAEIDRAIREVRVAVEHIDARVEDVESGVKDPAN